MKKAKFATDEERKQFRMRILKRLMTDNIKPSRQEEFQFKFVMIALMGGRRKRRDDEERMAARRPAAMNALVSGVARQLRKETRKK